jgi:hypothetical protein
MDIIKRCCKEKAGNGIKDEVCWRKCINAMHKKLSHIRLLPPAQQVHRYQVYRYITQLFLV